MTAAQKTAQGAAAAKEQPKPCSCCGKNPREPYAMRCWTCLYR